MTENARVEWLEARRKGLGGSDIAAMMGLSPWRSRYQLWQDKVGQIPHTAETEVMNWGKLMEPTLRQAYSNITGRSVRVPDKILYHKDHPIFFANLDGFTDDNRIVELKVARHSIGWGEPGTAEIPDNYALQVQHYLFVTGFDVADVVVSIGGGYPVLYEVAADAEIQKVILEEGLKFWQQVESGEAPDPVSYADAVAKFGTSNSIGSVYASPEIVIATDQLKAIRDQLKALEAQEEELKGKIITAIGDTGDTLVGEGNKVLVTYKLSAGRKTVDTKALEKEEPMVYARFLRVGAPSRRFLIK